jgi:hypothetical protein
VKITLTGLLEADTARVRAFAEHWFELAAALDTAVEDLGTATRDLPYHWSSGPGAMAAQERVARLQIQVGNGHQDCQAIAYAVRAFAENLEQNRQRLHEVVSEARSRGMGIDLESGQITAPVTTDAGLGLAQSGVDAYVQQIADILARADAADRETVAFLSRHEYYGLPSAVPPQPDPFALDVLADRPARQQAAWWEGLHPLLQEQLIAEHPEFVGALPGLPNRDRDRANRLLLSRAIQAAVADRNRIAAAQDDAGSRALSQADERVAATADLERRLAAPGVRLIGYQPGDERNATTATS